jgi:hypothetical protein
MKRILPVGVIEVGVAGLRGSGWVGITLGRNVSPAGVDGAFKKNFILLGANLHTLSMAGYTMVWRRSIARNMYVFVSLFLRTISTGHVAGVRASVALPVCL